jgi:DNA-binding response OmpR family regulator
MPDKLAKILIAEDDLNLGLLLVDYLTAEGFDVKLCKDGEQALKTFKEKSFDLCLLDVMMPKMDGFTLAGFIREQNTSIPLIFITAKSMRDDKVKGYTLGGDDYITKPFDEEELLWKIKALVRRTAAQQTVTNREIIRIGRYAFDPCNQCLLFGDQKKRMTEKETNVLKYMVSRANQVIKREQLLKDLWGENDYFFGRSLDVFISKMRKYLAEDSRISIENVFGVGFIFNLPIE